MDATNQTVAVIGTGAIGSAVTRTLLARGRDVVVWNRTSGRADAMVEAGARRAGSLKEAAVAPLVLLTLTDYAAVDAVLAELAPADVDRTLVVLATGGPEEARSAAARVAELGAAYLDGGVQAAPETVGTEAAAFLLSGDRASYERHRPTLELLGGTRFVGDAPGSAAVWDLALFGVWYDAQLGLLRALAAVVEAGIDATAFAETAATQLGHVVSSASDTAREVVTGRHPAGPASLVEHLPVLRRLASLHAPGPLGDGGLGATVARAAELVDAGRGEEGLSALVVRSSG
ncbi:NAD(P)-binding domain-containing protein [Nocardioides sp. TF02-7]|uniref:NAD(P)-dependent oxidoreductase n=1 Tax=Nocardioides sp. TF02-7 TaxID=2917724 RepID=UPI001F0521C5|nr:NAD(P)-binding domain-containing protein [Nocardioides sp. TF02-7]UMG91478.1 NAD(P)-binding domain-containing protein [Nocardioides sp. TF02-7]